MPISMTHFSSLSDIVLLEIFTYLSCEDALYAFADLQESHLIHLLTEHGAFQQICLSSQLSRGQYITLSNGIWRYDLVRSFVCKEMFSDFITDLTPCQIFPSLTELRILCLRCSSGDVSNFVIAHSSTLKHFIVTISEQSFIVEGYRKLFDTVLPHLNQLTLLDTDRRSCISVKWNKLAGCLQSLEHLYTFVGSMSDVYKLATDGFFPRLRSLCIHVNKSVIKTVLTEPSTTTKLHMLQLETFDLYLKRGKEAGKGVKWAVVETLTSYSAMPRLRQISLVYDLSTSTEIRQIFESSLFNNDKRHIDVRFVLSFNTSIVIDSSYIADIFHIRSSRYNDLLVKHNDEDKSTFRYTWCTSSWPSWTTFWMDHHDVVPRSGVRHLGIKTPNISLHLFGQLFSNINELSFSYPASLSMVDSMPMLTSLVNLRHLTLLNVVPGLEFLLDGVMLPRLRSLDVMIVPLFIALASRADQMKTLDTIDHLLITDQDVDHEERCFSLKQWYLVLDAFPRLRALLIHIQNTKCPPMALVDLLINYIRRTRQVSFTIFSCCIDDTNDTNSKKHFSTYFQDRMQMVCSPVQVGILGQTRFNAWF